MTDQTSDSPQETLDGPQGVQEASGGELAGRDGDSGVQAASGGSDWTRLEARAFNAVGPAVQQAGQWLPLSARRAVANAVLAELAPELGALARVQALIDEDPVAVGTHLLEAALDQTSHDTGPSVRECADNDRAHWSTRQWGSP